MSKKIMPLLLACGIAVSGGTAYASPVFLTRFSPETGSVNLIGEAKGYVTVKIADSDVPDGTFSEQNLPLIFDRIYSEGDFNYTIKLPDNTPSGKYNVYLRDSDGMTQGSFQFFDADNANSEIIPKLNSSKSSKDFDEYKNTVISSAENLGIDSEDSVYKSKESYIISLLYKAFDSFDDVSDFCNKYYYVYAVASISGADSSDVEDIMKKFSADLGIDFDADYNSDSKLNDKTRKSICEMLSKYDFEEAFSDGETFGTILESLKPMSSLANASKWQDIQKGMEEDYREEFKFIYDENDDYKSVSNMRSVYSEMMNGISSAVTYKDVQKLFDKAVKKALDESGNSGKKPSGTGGGGGGASSVVMPKDDTQIPQTTVIPTTKPDDKQSFNDITPGFWACEAIESLASQKAINGYADGSFRPNELITRAEYIKILVSLLGLEMSECSFIDVPVDSWYYGYIGAASKIGIAKGDSEKFNPDSAITRQDAATLLYRAISSQCEPGNPVSFSDESDIADYALDAVKTLSSLQILNGYTTGEFLPANNMTRAEVAQMLYNSAKSNFLYRQEVIK